MATHSIAEVVGLVHPLGSGGGHGQELTWSLNFSFVFWRKAGSEINERTLHVSKPDLTDTELRELMGAIKGDTVLRVRLRFPAHQDREDYLRAELIESCGPHAADVELNAKADQLRQPVTVKHPYFGILTLDRKFNWYETEVPWNSDPISLSLSLDDCDDEQALLASAHELFRGQQTWDKRIREYAVDELLSLGNEWLQEGEQELTQRTFNARINLQSISLNPDGSFEFWFDDGGIFGGHAIMVSGTLTDGPNDAGIHG